MAADFREALNDPNDDMNKFDSASGGDDLAAFDSATGETAIPAGWYDCTITRGELTSTKKGKTTYRIAFDVDDEPHRGFRFWRYFTFDSRASANWAKLMLAPLGLKSGADLPQPFPAPGRLVKARVLVSLRDDPQWGKRNDVERFEVLEDRAAPPNPNAVDPDKPAGGEGGAG